MDWQLLWSHEDSSFLPEDVRTYSMGAAGAGRCSCHADATFDTALRRCVDPTGEPLVDCGSVLQDGDVICTRCDYNASATLSSGFRPGEELCLAHLVVYPSEAVAQQQYTTRPSCRVGFTSTPTGCVDIDGPPPHVRRVSVLAGFVLRADGWFVCQNAPVARVPVRTAQIPPQPESSTCSYRLGLATARAGSQATPTTSPHISNGPMSPLLIEPLAKRSAWSWARTHAAATSTSRALVLASCGT